MDDDKCLDPDKFRKLIQRANDPEYGYYALYSWDTKVSIHSPETHSEL